MTSFAGRPQAIARRAQKRLYGEKCVYLAGGRAIEIVAIPTQPRALVNGEQAVIVDADALDFLIEAADLVVADELLEPADGHQVKRWRGQVEELFEVRSPGAEVRAYETVDAAGELFRVHAKRINQQ